MTNKAPVNIPVMFFCLLFIGCDRSSSPSSLQPSPKREAFKERRVYQRLIQSSEGPVHVLFAVTETEEHDIRADLEIEYLSAGGLIIKRAVEKVLKEAFLKDVDFRDLDHDGIEEVIMKCEQAPCNVVATIMRLGKAGRIRHDDFRTIFQGGGRMGYRIIDFDQDGLLEVVTCKAGSMFELMDCEVFALSSVGEYEKCASFETTREPGTWNVETFPSVSARVAAWHKRKK